MSLPHGDTCQCPTCIGPTDPVLISETYISGAWKYRATAIRYNEYAGWLVDWVCQHNAPEILTGTSPIDVWNTRATMRN